MHDREAMRFAILLDSVQEAQLCQKKVLPYALILHLGLQDDHVATLVVVC